MVEPGEPKDLDRNYLNAIFGALAGAPALLGYALLLVHRLDPTIPNFDGLIAVGVVLGVLGITFATCLFGFNGYKPLKKFSAKGRFWCATGMVLLGGGLFYGTYLLLFTCIVSAWLAAPLSLVYYAAGFYLCAVAFSSRTPTEK